MTRADNAPAAERPVTEPDRFDGRFDAPDPNRTTVFWRFARGALRIGSKLLFDLKVYGVRNLPRTGGVLVVANHQSYLDPALYGVDLPRPMSYLAKSDLFENPYFGWIIRQLRAFPVRQGKSDKGAIDETIRRLREGHMLQLYPEGSRSEDGEIRPLLRGAALVIRRANVPIIPAVVHGSFDAWPKGQRLPRPGLIRVLYGKPLNIEGMKSEEIVRLIDRTLHAMLEDLRAGKVEAYCR